MQGASRESLATGWQHVEQLLAASDVDAALIGDELFGVVDVLDGQAGLRRALSDPALEAERKAGLAESVFGSRVAPQTLAVVVGVVRSRWSRMRDLTDGLETLAVLAQLVAAERAAQSDDVEDELFRFARIIELRPELRDAISNANVPVDNRVALVRSLLERKATPTTVRLVTQLVSHPRGRTPEDALAEYGGVAARRRQRLVARVTTAIGLTDAERSRLRSALSALYGHDVHLLVEIDRELIGGLVVQVGDEVIDGSIAGLLTSARQRLE